MKTYEIYFHGRKKGALGLIQMFRAERTAENETHAELALYSDYEHISVAKINEKPEKSNG